MTGIAGAKLALDLAFDFHGWRYLRGLRENRIPVSVEERRRKKVQLLL
jgi:hypothetical protein